MADQTVIGERIKLWRWAKGLTQQEVAACCGVRQSCIADIENGRRAKEAPYTYLPQLAILFEVPEHYLREENLQPLRTFLRQSDVRRRQRFLRKLTSTTGKKIQMCLRGLGGSDPPNRGAMLRILYACTASSTLLFG